MNKESCPREGCCSACVNRGELWFVMHEGKATMRCCIHLLVDIPELGETELRRQSVEEQKDQAPA